ncbi:hypothetical protein [Chroococcus sp. FPU101]|uniref:hypothetical protein n=1 Tax=Chroococcus sp. FPU101 TaxID=1974212 RepID=UPI001A8E367E|nr:hypothetical protein [Chroococcus sp. FPU101]GFE69703.1 hypothetical protein CFPU101_23130 [Chroococcus sp. FPU101]
MMLINKLNIYSKTTTLAESQIVLKPFIDLYLDLAGWYAFGHHDPQAFLDAVVKQQPFEQFSTAQVQLTWAIFDGNNFEVTEVPSSESIAITLLEDWGLSC